MTTTKPLLRDPRAGAGGRRRESYDPAEIEPRWQRTWQDAGLYRTDLGDTSRPK